ncbi:MAG: hypothetical protein AAF227_09750, partial [Pseudomonadota bacterium]
QFGVKRDWLFALELKIDFQMILQIFPYTWKHQALFNIRPAQPITIKKSGSSFLPAPLTAVYAAWSLVVMTW